VTIPVTFGNGREGHTRHRHAKRHHHRRDQQRNALPHLLTPFLSCSSTPSAQQERRMEGADTRSSPTPFAMCWVVGLSPWGSVHRDPTTVRQPGYLSWRGPWALRHRLTAGLPLSRRRSARAHGMYRTNSEEGDIYAEWPFISIQAGRMYARWLFLTSELLRTPCMRTSQNSYSTHLGE
jgi:hypothetical protein